ncbi:MAG TPA: polysaccharide biosynthesis/export family protein [Candidatus Cybelea sp.]|nr:polysaccharide biosynthesis/export family protein [Candidatus Cybelea sp.]
MLRLAVAFLIATLWAAVPARAQTNGSEKTTATVQPDRPEPTHKAATDNPNYIIGPQDVLDVDVWKEPELTRSIPVRPDGKISLPLLNDVQAAGLTPTKLADEITSGLKKYVTDPQVTVIVSAINSQRVYILGEVTRAGAYPLLPDMTVLQALSSAGGFTQFANEKKIYVLRNENGKQEKFPFNYKAVVSGRDPDENIALQAGDTVVVP